MGIGSLVLGTDYNDINGANSFHFTRKDGTATWVIHLYDWNKIPTLLGALFPPALGGVPQVDFVYPFLPFLTIDAVDIKPFNEVMNTASPPVAINGAEVTLMFKSKPEDNATTQNQKDDTPDKGQNTSQTLLEWDVDVGGQFISYPTRGLQWQSDSKKPPPDVQFGVAETTIEHNITWHFCPMPPWAAIRRCRGRVNTGSFLGAPDGCLLFHGVKGKRSFSTSGTFTWDVTFHFSEKNNGGPVALNPDGTQPPNFGENFGWNYYLRPDLSAGVVATFDKLVLAGSNLGMYMSQDFTNLFIPGGT